MFWFCLLSIHSLSRGKAPQYPSGKSLLSKCVWSLRDYPQSALLSQVKEWVWDSGEARGLSPWDWQAEKSVGASSAHCGSVCLVLIQHLELQDTQASVWCKPESSVFPYNLSSYSLCAYSLRFKLVESVSLLAIKECRLLNMYVLLLQLKKIVCKTKASRD